MALLSKGNKNSATEDEVGLLHALVTKIFAKKLGYWMKLIEEGGDPIIVNPTTPSGGELLATSATTSPIFSFKLPPVFYLTLCALM